MKYSEVTAVWLNGLLLMPFTDNVPPALRRRLEENGFDGLDEIKQVDIIQLTRDLELSKQDVLTLFELTRENSIQSQTAAECIEVEKKRGGISSSCPGLDRIFGQSRGVPFCRITEICGESGTGKTQLCIQLALNVQLSGSQSKRECIYIDTEGSLLQARLAQVAASYEEGALMLKRVHIFNVLDHIELIALIRQLPDILKEYPNVKLVVIDSIAFPMRLNIRESRIRTGLLTGIAYMLMQVATSKELAVVVTNHVTNDGTSNAWIPALGQSWAHWCAYRVFLYRIRHRRCVSLSTMAPCPSNRPIYFSITNNGITVPEDEDEDEDIAHELIKPENGNEAKELQGSLSYVKEEEQEEDPSLDIWDSRHLTDEIVSQLSPATSLLYDNAFCTVADSQPDDSLLVGSDDGQREKVPTVLVEKKRKRSIQEEEIWSDNEDEQEWLFLAGMDSW